MTYSMCIRVSTSLYKSYNSSYDKVSIHDREYNSERVEYLNETVLPEYQRER